MPHDTGGPPSWLQVDTRAESGILPSAGVLLVPGLTILYHPDLERVGERVALAGLTSGREEPLSRAVPSFSRPGSSVRCPLADSYLSRRPLRLMPGGEPGSVRLACADSGTSVIADGAAVDGERGFSALEVERGVVLLLANRVVLLLSLLDPVGTAGVPAFGLVGESVLMVHLRREIQRVAGLGVPVLLRGETGTGKELVARALHEAGPRRFRPYLAVNMAAIPASLAASELFGAARGAYTGADRKRAGYFQKVDGGTLFLDEVGETPPEIQTLLLRALETREIQPVGGDDPVEVDVRLVAATDADLERAVEAGRFRAPLLHRLAGYEIRVPPLRQRRDDFGRLFDHFVRRALEELGEAHRLATPPDGRPWIPASLVASLATWDWPGNIRQLKNAVLQIVIAGRDAGEAGMWRQAEHLSREAARVPEPADTAVRERSLPLPPAPKRQPRKGYRNPEEVTEEELLESLRAHRWRIQRVAKALGFSRASLYDRIEKSARIRKAADLSREEIEECRKQCGGDLDAMAERLEVSKRGLQLRMTRLGLS